LGVEELVGALTTFIHDIVVDHVDENKSTEETLSLHELVNSVEDHTDVVLVFLRQDLRRVVVNVAVSWTTHACWNTSLE